MNTATNTVEDVIQSEYKYGFVTDIEADTVAPGLNEDVIRLISAKKNEPTFMLEWRLKPYRHWVKLEKSQAEPKWANVHYPAIDYQAISYYSAPKFKGKLAELGVIFGSFSEAVKEHPELVQKYLGSVVPYTDNFFASLNSAVFSDGSFCYIPKGVRCPME